MKKIIVIIGIILVGIALVAVGVVTFFVKTIDPNTYKDKISQMVYENTGRQLSLNGTINWSLFPWLGMKIHDVALSNAGYFKDIPFASAGEIDVTVRLVPLIFGKVEVGKIVLRDFNLQLVKNSAGETNWKDLIDHINSNNTSPSKPAPEWMVRNVDISNANIIWRNQQIDKVVEIKNLQLSSGNINFGKPFAIKADFAFSNLPTASGNIHVEGVITADVVQQVYALEQARLSGGVNGNGLVGKLNFSVNADAIADMNKQTFDISDLNITAAGMNVAGKVHGTSIIDAPTFTGVLSVSAFDPKPLLGVLGYACDKNAGICQSAAADLNVQTTSKFLKVTKLSIKFDNSVLDGSGSYSHFDDKNVVFNLDINKIDFDRYIAGIKVIKASPAVKVVAKAAPVKKSVSRKKVAISGDKGGWYAALRELKLNADLHVADLKFTRTHLTDVYVEINGDGDVVNLNPITFKLYQGTAQGGVAINIKKSAPAFAAKANLVSINLQKMFADILGEEKIGGVASFNAGITTYGNNVAGLLHNLNGNGKLAVNNGMLNGIDVKYQIDRADALVHQKNPPKETLPSQTRFDQLSATFKLTNGSLSSNDLLLRSPYCKVLGKGAANLATQILNYQMEAYGMRDNKPTNFYVPIKITGTFTDPKVSPDVAVLVGQVIQNVIKDQLHKQIERGLGIPGDASGLVKSLDKLFK